MPAKVHRNLLLGVGLVLAASAALLLSDSGGPQKCLAPNPRSKPGRDKVADVQETDAGVIEGLDSATVDRLKDVTTRRRPRCQQRPLSDSAATAATAQAIVRQFHFGTEHTPAVTSLTAIHGDDV